jgi:hypothetical protein
MHEVLMKLSKSLERARRRIEDRNILRCPEEDLDLLEETRWLLGEVSDQLYNIMREP